MNQLNEFQKEKVKEKISAWILALNSVYETMFEIEQIIGKTLPINMETISQFIGSDDIAEVPLMPLGSVTENVYQQFMKEAEEFEEPHSYCANGVCSPGEHFDERRESKVESQSS